MKLQLTERSSNIYGVSHNPRTKTLRVYFLDKRNTERRRRGASYEYYPVPAEQAVELVNAESVGKYFITHLRNNKRISYRKVDDGS